MRIGMMADIYKSHISGVTNYIKLIKRCLEDAGHEVYVFTFDSVGGVDEHENIVTTSGIPVTDFFINLQYDKQARRILSSMDIVHVHHPFASGLLATTVLHTT